MPTLSSHTHAPAMPVRASGLEHTGRRARSPLAWWHLLSLDAPSIAVLWTWFIAAAEGISVSASALLAMFFAVWTLYAGDRLLDTRSLALPSHSRHHGFRVPPLRSFPDRAFAPDFEERHVFHAQHRRPFLLAIAGATLGLASLLPILAPAVIRLDLMLGALLAGYFLLIHATPAAHRLPKEIAVGVFFSAAVFIPTVARAPGLQRPLLPSALLFAALCSLNCLYIYSWEHEPSRHGEPLANRRRLPPSPARPSENASGDLHAEPHRVTRLALRHQGLLSGLVIVLAVTLAVFEQSPSIRTLPLTIGLSAVLLSLLGRARRRFRRVDLRAAADLALATPLCAAPLLWLLRG